MIKNCSLETPLLINNITEQYATLLEYVKDAPEACIDLSNIPNIDSSGIALLLEIKQLAKKQGCKLVFKNSTDLINRLCQLYKITL